MKKYIVIVSMFMFTLVFGMVPAYAVPTYPALTFDNGIDPTFAVVDGDVNDVNSIVGAVTYVGSYGTGANKWALNVSTGQTKPFLGDAMNGHIDLNSVNTSSIGSGTLVIKWSDLDFGPMASASGVNLTVGGTLAAGAGNSFSLSGYVDTSNALNGTGTLVGTISAIGGSSTVVIGGIANGGVPASTLFSMTEIATIYHASAGTTSFDADMKVPEPATLLLMGAGLLGLGIFGRKKIKG